MGPHGTTGFPVRPQWEPVGLALPHRGVTVNKHVAITLVMVGWSAGSLQKKSCLSLTCASGQNDVHHVSLEGILAVLCSIVEHWIFFCWDPFPLSLNGPCANPRGPL